VDIRLDGAHNFRDLGGLETADGRRTLTGRLFRSDTLANLTVDDVETLRGLGIRTILDLRAPAEIELQGRGPLADHPMTYVNAALFPAVAAMSAEEIAMWDEDLAAAYVMGLEGTRDVAVAALELIAAEDSLPLAFHCNAGKDRTGVIAALVLGCVGVTHEAIVADYAESARRLEPILARLRTDPTLAPSKEAWPPRRLGAAPETMRRFLEMLEERFGGAAAWARSAGVTDATLATLSRALVSE
jgi:protein-tyrosine phosphatase